MNASKTQSKQTASNGNHYNGGVVVLCAEEGTRDVIAYWLNTLGMPTTVADDGYHAAKLVQNGCGWLITDRVLPPWPGLDTFITLRARKPDLKIAFVENSNIHEGVLARVTGASVLLQQPLKRQAVIDAVSSSDRHP